MRTRTYIGIGLVATVVIVAAALTWRPNTPQASPLEVKNTLYVALGDSVASGLGLATPGDSSGCGRTREAYPYLLAAKTDYQLVHLACSGATLQAGINGPQVAAGEQLSQRDALFQREPGLITLGIGANDVAWLSLLAQCLEVGCGREEDKVAYDRMLADTVQPQLRETLEFIESRYKNAHLMIIGYYQVFPQTGKGCEDTAGLDGPALTWARELRSRLNQAVSDTVKDTGVGAYVEIDFSGHELCAAEPWVQGLSDPAPYHANTAGQEAIAEQIAEVLKRE